MNDRQPPEAHKRATFSVDLGELRAPLLAACESAGLRPAEAVRGLIGSALRGEAQSVLREVPLTTAAAPVRRRRSVPSTPGRPKAGTYERQIKKLTIRLGESEALLASEVAEREGFTVSRWIAALVRQRLVGEPQFSGAEIQVLAAANVQLGAIGRNLNQVARALNSQDYTVMTYDKELIDGLRDAIKSHREAVSRLILANTERWQVGRHPKP